MILKFFIIFLPWFLKRIVLQVCFGYKIHPKAYIGLSWIYPQKLIMHEGANIGMFNVAIHLDAIEMHNNSTISRGNWITGFPSGNNSMHFKHQLDRKSMLVMGEHSSITKNHHIDCTNAIRIGCYSTIAGYQSQLLTHSIDIIENRQHSAPIVIGDYTFLGTNSVILGGSSLPSYCILGAKSLLNKYYSEQHVLYGGVPAKPIKNLLKDSKYFNRPDGFVY